MINLLSKSEFRTNIRTYNASFAFCSFKATADETLTAGSIYTMKIMGMIYHRIGPLLPTENKNIKAAQIYIHDGQHKEDQTQARQSYSDKLLPITLKLINWILTYDCTNPYIEQFHKAGRMLKENPKIPLQIVIDTSREVDKRTYNRPTTNEIAVLIPTQVDLETQQKRQIIVFEKNGTLKIINVNRASYDPLMYVLMFPYGQLGWEFNFYKLIIKEFIN